MTTDKTGAISTWLDEQAPAMLALLGELVDIDSGSYDKAGVDRVGARLVRFYAEHLIDVTTVAVPDFGDILRATTGPVRHSAGRRNYLMMGHRDTVFGKGEAARRPFSTRDGRAYGPGVADMKAGLVMNAFVMAALKRFAPEIPVVALMTGDEEIGSATARPYIEADAKCAVAVFNSEPGRVSGNIVTGRKGGFSYRFDITGKAAHSGVNFTEGASAIAELAHKINALHALTRVEDGMTLNVGIVGGGVSVNTIAPTASGEVDVRFVTNAQRDWLIEAIDAIMANSSVLGTCTKAVRDSDFFPLVPTPLSDGLTMRYLQVARNIGLDIAGEFTGGCADSGFAASAGAPTICGVGPVGGKAHTEEEYIEIATLAQRARVAALTICAMAQ
ncbi:M20 family peptidase [Mesorhizobium sp. M7D.F.Ca.US.005.01.1.1]|uniref:M20 family metallopeptidase n=1 Tax=Mesorhizobium sp. M7D.F.Ca.US.005.01.1.1 TaxID=2493678 RepID=UPI000F75A889|nr:M20 family metallopeptidase [Mesorhizobium sp. M7D.F.Ca.US.005.01.1.1]AZO41653.1 M20 family peptidase [Mesorhizobium sp. M7D.F.Ca.US.005.01.1.1]